MSLFFLIVVAAIGWLLYTLYLKKLLSQGKSGQIKLVLIALGLVFLIMALTGRAHALFAILGAAMTQVMRIAPLLLRFAPSLKRYLSPGMFSAGAAKQAGVSQVSTATLVMTLNQVSGKIEGEVIAGEFAGRPVHSLSIAELQSLYTHCSENDTEALRLLQAYITRERSDDWEQATGGAADEQPGKSTGVSNTQMTLTEAKQVLGIDGELTRQSIITAHRSLMGRFHPDKGGNDYLATKINKARDILLNHTTT